MSGVRSTRGVRPGESANENDEPLVIVYFDATSQGSLSLSQGHDISVVPVGRKLDAYGARYPKSSKRTWQRKGTKQTMPRSGRKGRMKPRRRLPRSNAQSIRGARTEDVLSGSGFVSELQDPADAARAAIELDALRSHARKGLRLQLVIRDGDKLEVVGQERRPRDLRKHFRLDQQFIGHVREVNRPKGTFIAWLGEREDERDLAEAEIMLSELTPGDQSTIAPGHVFYWIIGRIDVEDDDGRVLDRSNESKFIFRTARPLDEQQEIAIDAEVRRLLARHAPEGD